jgi:hypothetical protein
MKGLQSHSGAIKKVAHHEEISYYSAIVAERVIGTDIFALPVSAKPPECCSAFKNIILINKY